MLIDHELIDNLLKDYKTPEQIVSDNNFPKQLNKAALEPAVQAEGCLHVNPYQCAEHTGHTFS